MQEAFTKVESWYDAGRRLTSSATVTAVEVTTLEAAASVPSPPSEVATINYELTVAKSSKDVLDIFSSKEGSMNAVNLATTLHKLATLNKHDRAGRDALMRSSAFEQIVDSIISQADSFSPRSVADIAWSLATLQHLPAVLLKPLLTCIAKQLDLEGFEAQHLSTVTWSFARLQCKPVRLLEQIERQVISQMGSANVQNCAMLLWGFGKLNYTPKVLLPILSKRLLEPGMLESAKPVEVADIAFGLGLIGTPNAHDDLVLGLAARASADKSRGCLSSFSTRQVVILIWSVARLKAAALLPDGRLDEWVGAVRAGHEAIPLLAHDARNLERSLELLGLDASWIARSDILNTWMGGASGDVRSKSQREYTDEELRVAFTAIDTDDSGDIDPDELLKAIQTIRPDADASIVQQMLTFADTDGDEQISFEEFKQIILAGIRRHDAGEADERPARQPAQTA